MNLKIMAVLLVVLLGGMAIYYNLAATGNADDANAPVVEKTK